MGKIPCDIIRDLLPLYEDHICSERSKHEIEEHLIECENCQQYYDSIHEKLPPVTLLDDSNGITGSKTQETDSSFNEDIEFIKKIYRKLNRRQLITLITCGIIILIILTLSIANDDPGINESLRKIPAFDWRIDTEKIKITELYQLENGNIYVTLESKQPFAIASWGFEPPSENISPSSSYNNGLAILSLRRAYWSELFDSAVPMSKSSFVLPLKEAVTIDDDSKLIIHESSSIYFEGKCDKRLLIWKSGQELDPAPNTIEEKVRNECKPAIDTDIDYSTTPNCSQEDSEEAHIFIFDDRMYQ